MINIFNNLLFLFSLFLLPLYAFAADNRPLSEQEKELFANPSKISIKGHVIP
jgi:hypothetical protein